MLDKLAPVKVEVTSQAAGDAAADVEVVGLFEGDEVPGPLGAVPGAGDAKGTFKKSTILRPDAGRRVLVAGLGKAADLDPERLRVAAAIAAKAATACEAGSLAWDVPASDAVSPADAAAAITEGTILATFKFDRYRSSDPDEPSASLERLVLAGAGDDVAGEVDAARVASEAANRARLLQSLPANELKPESLAARAREIAAAHEAVSVEVFDRDEIVSRGMGGLAAVSSGAETPPRLISLRYEGGGSAGRVGLVGKGVTFDSGGISIKPSAGMQEMKMDMSGAAAVLEAFAAITELDLALDVVAVIPATENMPSGTATRPGDIITQLNGKTVQIDNTDAEGRLILADALTYCVRDLEAERVVDLATLTGAVVVALGSTYAALISNDDDWADAVADAGDEAGELAWRLPLHPEYKELTKGTVADLTNAAAKRRAGTIYAGSFLEEFVDEKPWAHLDIAGTSWDVGREYVGSGPTGFGVRLLVELARELAD
jgi:leucyl aminopeptidase